jgi:sortase A
MKKVNKKIINRISFILVITGIMLSLYPLYTSLNSFNEQRKLEKELAAQTSRVEEPTEEEVTLGESPLIEEISSGTSATENPQGSNQAPALQAPKKVKALMRMEIPQIGLATIVVAGTSPAALKDGPGWYEQSAYPGEGNTAIAGHKNMYGSWFRNIHKLQPGNLIRITYQGKKYTYTVEKVSPIATDDWSVIAPTKEAVLTLTTCYTKTERLACRAVLQEITEP